MKIIIRKSKHLGGEEENGVTKKEKWRNAAA